MVLKELLRNVGLVLCEEFVDREREFVFSDDKERTGLFGSLGLGITKFTKNEEYGEYLTEKGFTEFKVGSRSRVPSIRRAENKMLKDFLPLLVENATEIEKDLRKEYKSLDKGDTSKNKYTEDQYVNNYLVPVLKTDISKAKSTVSVEMSEDTEIKTVLMEKLRRLTPSQRRFAMSEFFKEEGHIASLTDEDDIGALVAIGKSLK